MEKNKLKKDKKIATSLDRVTRISIFNSLFLIVGFQNFIAAYFKCLY